ncbi:MAG: HD domain-containing protein [Candidatus Campbellbacteria bacterium]|nr:HD domain-containing protein [Candidatus Campbellbacteria bacterium]
MEKDIGQILDFLKEIRKLHHTYRFTPQPNGGYENDAEHSWSVAVTCMLLKPRLEKEFETKLDGEKMLKMALIHDLAEIQTGDTKTWDTDSRVNKEEKERAAIHSMTTKLPDDLRDEVLKLWEECEAKETPEAKAVKSIDRFDSVVHRTTFEIGWKGKMEEEHATVSALDARQLPRHSFSKVLTMFYELIRNEGVSKGMFHQD